MDFQDIKEIEKATRKGRSEVSRFGIALFFIICVMLYSSTLSVGRGAVLLVIAAMIGGYMAMNIGANDVANNVGPSVGSKAITMGGALVIAAIFEAAGALIAGGDVVATIRSGIIDPARIPGGDIFIWLMMSALLAGALWLNIATAMGAPVSTTHSIVGAVLGAGIAAAGPEVVHWDVITSIVASWVISPLLGGIVAALLLLLVKRAIIDRRDMTAAAVENVPILIAFMVCVFTVYLLLKGLSNIWQVTLTQAGLSGLAVGALAFLLLRPLLRARAHRIENSREGVNQIFTLPLIFSAALLSFAHGANDVANAVGPLAAIYDAISPTGSEIADKAAIPLWVMVVGAIGISVGLGLFGPKVIRTVGSEITELDKISAYCVAMSATMTVIVASHLGLPVSSTHIAVGGVFGVGFLREYLIANYARIEAEIRAHHPEDDLEAIDTFLARFNSASVKEKGEMLAELKHKAKLRLDPANFSKPERRDLKKVYRREVVKRAQVKKIVATWVITVPFSAFMAAGIFYLLRGMM
ncbi:MAG: inorganic phosphate transporter [Zoogloeaceae bacterium]|jgi:PiT family inorganic phosphate transporter|nr:inorganic phosphate transporter [Zoogloeaceae bacterium]